MQTEMGRLFWKFFLFLWLAQLTTVIAVGMTIWFIESKRNQSVSKPAGEMPSAEAPGVLTPLPPTFSDNGTGLRQVPPPAELGAKPPPPMTSSANLPGAGIGMDGSQAPPPPGDFANNRLPGEPPMDQLLSASPMDQPPPVSPKDQPPHAPNQSIAPPMLPLLAGSLVSLIFAAILGRYFTRPIRTLSQAFEKVAKGRMDTRIGKTMGSRHDELADLGRGFDSMADRLQSLVEDKQRLLHDVSHELRSPLARLQAAIDLMQQQPERSSEFVSRIERESSRIDRLVGELLAFSRLDSGIPGNQIQEFDLIEMVEAIAEDASFEAETKPCHVITALPEKACMTGDPDLLHRAIENIVRNGIRHTPKASSITIRGELNADQTWLTLDITDQGDGVPESELKLIFEPFYRSPAADRFKGYGIGMAITQRVVDAHKGKVSARNHKEGGLIVTIELPLKKEATC
jgi:signal transduction histidine kinase